MREQELRTYLYQKLEVLREDSKGNVYCVCPECGDVEQKFSVNVYKKVFNCWRASCGYRGRITKLVKKFGPINSDYEFPNENITEEKPEEVELTREGYFQIYSQYFQNLVCLEGTLAGIKLENFCSEKHTTISQLKDRGIRVCVENFEEEKWYGRFRGYLALPFYDIYGKIQFFQFRVCPGFHSVPKWKYPKAFSEEWKADKFLYFSNPNFVGRDYVIVESIFDSIRVGENAIALGGSHCSPSQLKRLACLKAERFVLLLDSDTPTKKGILPGQKATYGIARILSEYTTKEIWIPPDNYFGQGIDPDEMGDEMLGQVLSGLIRFRC